MFRPEGKRLIACTWADAHGGGQGQEYELAHRPVHVTSVGWEVMNDAEGVSICSEVCADGVYRDHTFVPRAMVVEVVELSSRPRPKRAMAGTSAKRARASAPLLPTSQRLPESGA